MCSQLFLVAVTDLNYSILDPGMVPEIKPVTRYFVASMPRYSSSFLSPNLHRYPGQDSVGGDIKVPTVIYYDELGNACAIGAETLKEGVTMEAEEKRWTKCHW